MLHCFEQHGWHSVQKSRLAKYRLVTEQISNARIDDSEKLLIEIRQDQYRGID